MLCFRLRCQRQQYESRLLGSVLHRRVDFSSNELSMKNALKKKLLCAFTLFSQYIHSKDVATG